MKEAIAIKPHVDEKIVRHRTIVRRRILLSRFLASQKANGIALDAPRHCKGFIEFVPTPGWLTAAMVLTHAGTLTIQS